MMTEFGKVLRVIRLEEGDLLKNMAEKLGVTASYLSAVEVGKRNIPANWIHMIIDRYDLSEDMKKKLKEAYANTAKQISLELDGAGPKHRNLAMAFAREFKDLDPEDNEAIFKILNKKKM